jgi:acetyl esterase/lipase
MPPQLPFPIPLEDCLSVYREMLKSYPANKILVSGGSAGGSGLSNAAPLVLTFNWWCRRQNDPLASKD